MYFEAELKGFNFKVDVTEARNHWKIGIQKEEEPCISGAKEGWVSISCSTRSVASYISISGTARTLHSRLTIIEDKQPHGQ